MPGEQEALDFILLTPLNRMWRLNKMRAWLLRGTAEKVSIVDLRERTSRGIRKGPEQGPNEGAEENQEPREQRGSLAGMAGVHRNETLGAGKPGSWRSLWESPEVGGQHEL